MKIIQISDLHINSLMDIEFAEKIINSLYDSVCNKINNSDYIIFVICGDIFVEGDDSCCKKAIDIVNKIDNKFKTYKHSFEFTPGNHDICLSKTGKEFDHFNEFSKSIVSNYPEYTSECSVIVREYPDIDFILINSAYLKDHRVGSYDKKQLEQKLKQLDNSRNKIMVMHHTIISEYEKDSSAIRNAYDLINIAQSNNFSAILHGHTHGLSELVIGEDKCKVIGVAPLLKKQELINLQFNLISLFEGKVISIENFKYSSDAKINKSRGGFEGREYSYGSIPNLFQGESIKKIYASIVERIKNQKLIYNLNILNACKIDDFIFEIESNYSEYIAKATQWQTLDYSDNIYFNHGKFLEYYNDTGTKKHGVDYIIEELIKKKTSSRAFMSLVNMSNIIKTNDDCFLPSLILIQCSFENKNSNKLYLTMYLRALEISEFFKINICEIYLILKKIKEKMPVDELQIQIHAFRAQYLENFSCFEKSKIDQLSAADMSGYLYRKETDKIVDLLKEKLSKSETVIITTGLSHLQESIDEYVKNSPNNIIFHQELMAIFNELSKAINDMQNKRKMTSIHADIAEYEDKIKKLLSKIINEIEKINL